MFEIPVVKDCPVTRASKGRVRIQKWILAEILRTMQEETGKEWALWLEGKRSKDGLDIQITKCSVPPQHRSGSNVKIPTMEIPNDVIGVLHSHHAMGAFFSGTDNEEFNTRYALSIVISTQFSKGELPWTWFGFKYKAEGRVTLPCGSLGIVPFIVEPLEEIEGWPRLHTLEMNLTDPEAQKKGLGDCLNIVPSESDRPLFQGLKAACGIQSSLVVPKVGIFGLGTGNIAKLLPTPVGNVDYPDRKAYHAAEAAADKEYAEIRAGRKRWLGPKKEEPEDNHLLKAEGEELEEDFRIDTNVVEWLRKRQGLGLWDEDRLKGRDLTPITMIMALRNEPPWSQMEEDERIEWLTDVRSLTNVALRLGMKLKDFEELSLLEAEMLVEFWEDELEQIIDIGGESGD